MDISTLATEEALEAIAAMETVDQLREAATSINVKFSGNTGIDTLRAKLIEAVNNTPATDLPKTDGDLNFLGSTDEDELPIQEAVKPEKPKGPSLAELLEMDASKIEDKQLRRQVVRAKAMRLHRVRITNLNPSDAQLSGAIVTVMNQYTGKVSKYVPFGDESENGYHIPEILLNHLKSQKFALRSEIKGGQFGVKKYKTKMINKFAIEELPMLSKGELEDLADHQRASHAIDN